MEFDILSCPPYRQSKIDVDPGFETFPLGQAVHDKAPRLL